MFLVPLLSGLSPWKAKGALPNFQWFFYSFILIFIVGFRHEVGGDWFTYIENYERLIGVPFTGLLSGASFANSFGFEVLHWFSMNYLNGIYATNLICATIVIVGMMRICRNMPVPWIALSVATPYFLIVVSMGYTRQAVAIGFIMWGILDLVNGKQIRFYFLVLMGALFHKTAIIMLPVGFLYANSIRNIKDLILLLLLFGMAFMAFMLDRFEFLLYHYVTNTQLDSSGAFIRVLMNVSAAVTFLFFRKKWVKKYDDTSLWMIFSIISIIMLPLTFVSSTTVDRFALYFIPLQLLVFSRVPVLIEDIYQRTLFVLVVLLVYTGVLYIWLNFGSYSSHWLPYQNYLFK